MAGPAAEAWVGLGFGARFRVRCGLLDATRVPQVFDRLKSRQFESYRPPNDNICFAEIIAAGEK
jgi:hypothetical protein